MQVYILSYYDDQIRNLPLKWLSMDIMDEKDSQQRRSMNNGEAGDGDEVRLIPKIGVNLRLFWGGVPASGCDLASLSFTYMGKKFFLQDDEAAFASILHHFMQKISISEPSPKLLTSFDLEGIAELISTGKAKKIVCLCGAGISVSAGIPDFRTPGMGLYSRLAEYNLPEPTDIFDIDFFRENPNPFYRLAKELCPGNFVPTPTHFFMKILQDKGLLLRCFTQNIDSLEVLAGLAPERVIAAHGNFDTASCIECQAQYEMSMVKAAIMNQDPFYCTGTVNKTACKGLVKPSIVFFGENLPDRFWKGMDDDLPAADLLIVMGTSLVVQPFASLIHRVSKHTPRLLINRERVGEAKNPLDEGFVFGKGNYRDALYLGDCDEGILDLCKLLGWEEELQKLISGWKDDKIVAHEEEDAGLAEQE